MWSRKQPASSGGEELDGTGEVANRTPFVFEDPEGLGERPKFV
jgi:hypothetical protein